MFAWRETAVGQTCSSVQKPGKLLYAFQAEIGI